MFIKPEPILQSRAPQLASFKPKGCDPERQVWDLTQPPFAQFSSLPRNDAGAPYNQQYSIGFKALAATEASATVKIPPKKQIFGRLSWSGEDSFLLPSIGRSPWLTRRSLLVLFEEECQVLGTLLSAALVCCNGRSTPCPKIQSRCHMSFVGDTSRGRCRKLSRLTLCCCRTFRSEAQPVTYDA